jgi:hypothetical protein
MGREGRERENRVADSERARVRECERFRGIERDREIERTEVGGDG